jgi:acyl-coenzyme A synthetase/AMP-(fatty) acid ligase
VRDSGVVGLKDPMRGEVPLAFVQAKEGMTIDPAQAVSRSIADTAVAPLP